MNHNQSSRPFLRLFSALQSTDQPAETASEMSSSPANFKSSGERDCGETSAPAAGLVAYPTCDQHHDTTHQRKPLQSEEKMIAGTVGPRSEKPVSPSQTSPGQRSPGQRSVDCSTDKPRRVEVSLADIAPVLADAINHQRGWLSDFSDDTVTIDADLYEVLLAYQQMRRLNAA